MCVLEALLVHTNVTNLFCLLTSSAQIIQKWETRRRRKCCYADFWCLSSAVGASCTMGGSQPFKKIKLLHVWVTQTEWWQQLGGGGAVSIQIVRILTSRKSSKKKCSRSGLLRFFSRKKGASSWCDKNSRRVQQRKTTTRMPTTRPFGGYYCSLKLCVCVSLFLNKVNVFVSQTSMFVKCRPRRRTTTTTASRLSWTSLGCVFD